MNLTAIEFQNVQFKYPNKKLALNNINLKIPKGKKTAIIGHNGAGKTTLLLHLNGINRPNEGNILINGEKIIYDRQSIKELRKKIGIVFQDPEHQLFSSDVFNDISFGLKNLDYSDEIIQEKTKNIMEKLDITKLSEQPIHYLSLGQKKRVALAGVLVMEPEILVLDEPTAYLDPETINEFTDYLDLVNTDDRTMILSTHNLNFAYNWADYLVVMKDGIVLAFGEAEEIFANRDLLSSTNLVQPDLLLIYQELKKDNLIVDEAKHPLSVKQLIDIIKNKA